MPLPDCVERQRRDAVQLGFLDSPSSTATDDTGIVALLPTLLEQAAVRSACPVVVGSVFELGQARHYADPWEDTILTTSSCRYPAAIVEWIQDPSGPLFCTPGVISKLAAEAQKSEMVIMVIMLSPNRVAERSLEMLANRVPLDMVDHHLIHHSWRRIEVPTP